MMKYDEKIQEVLGIILRQAKDLSNVVSIRWIFNELLYGDCVDVPFEMIALIATVNYVITGSPNFERSMAYVGTGDQSAWCVVAYVEGEAILSHTISLIAKYEDDSDDCNE